MRKCYRGDTSPRLRAAPGVPYPVLGSLVKKRLESFEGKTTATTQNHQMAWVRRDFKDHPALAPLDQVAPSKLPVNLQGWGIHDFSGQQPVPVPHQPSSKTFSPNI